MILFNRRMMEGVNDMTLFFCCRKLSSSDLHSRLKTRKVLGVGETDDGDVHRSKVRIVMTFLCLLLKLL